MSDEKPTQPSEEEQRKRAERERNAKSKDRPTFDGPGKEVKK